jgi:hypothetical protein
VNSVPVCGVNAMQTGRNRTPGLCVKRLRVGQGRDMRAFDRYMQLAEAALQAADHAVNEEQRKSWIKISDNWLMQASAEATSTPECSLLDGSTVAASQGSRSALH